MEALSANDPRAVGEFQLRARLGAGGMGRVYLGYSPAGRAVAIKVVHPELARDAEFRERFGREVAAARAVSGMYTAPVVAAGLDDDPPWLATAFVPGPSLADVVARHGPLPEPAVWRLAAGLAEALRAVHACSLVHRDLKPANVLLAADGPHVIDFGISRAFEGTSVTAAGMVVGTPGYMSPEQAEGAQAGPASDVFSLGCVLAYAATGNAPFGGGSAASVLYRLVSTQPELSGVPGKLRDVIAGCLAKNPSQRPRLAALCTMITQSGPVVNATLTSFWPAPVAEIIRTAAAAAGQVSPAPSGVLPSGLASSNPPSASMVPDGSYAATASMAVSRPGAVAPGVAPGSPSFTAGPPTLGAGVSGGPTAQAQPARWPQATPARPGPSSWPPSGPAAPWPPPSSPDALSRYTPAPLQPWRPTSVLTAVRMMYSGAVASVLGLLIDLSVISQLKYAWQDAHPLLSPTGVNRLAGIGDFAVVIGSAISITMWLVLASAAKKGRGWARTTGTVLFGVDTLGLIVTIGRPGIAEIKAIHLVIWLIGLVTVVLLWQPRSSEYFSFRR
jgi:serine/threonine protein kinase